MTVSKKVSWINQIPVVKVSKGLQWKVQTKNNGKITPKGKSFPAPNTESFYLDTNYKENQGGKWLQFIYIYIYIYEDIYYIYTY